ncbi:MAG: metallophosphoesterase [Deltaproteobacteria bacterium]|nr:metallophosphoesterase [Deltaproteobacteria bacterium]
MDEMMDTMTTEKVELPEIRVIKNLDIQKTGKIVVMSDCHRGDGSGSDDFAPNSLIYRQALEQYLSEGFTYVELGDAEELWENKTFDQIYITHTKVYETLHKFHDPDPDKTRYIKVWGNHDLYWQDHAKVYEGLFPGIQIYEAVILRVPSRINEDILMIHGHQADPICTGGAAAFSKFFVKNLWAELQKCGLKDPTRAACNPGVSDETDATLHRWSTENGKGFKTIIAGHTHRAVYENLSITERRYLESQLRTTGVKAKYSSDTGYYNTGSCVHPQSITALEILPSLDAVPKFRLIEWRYAAHLDGSLYVERGILAG